MIGCERMPVIFKTSAGIWSERIMTISRTITAYPPVIVKISSIQIRYMTSTKVNGELGRLKGAVRRLRLRYKSEEKKNEYKTKLLQDRTRFRFKATTK